jgi:hypothetical protein
VKIGGAETRKEAALVEVAVRCGGASSRRKRKQGT